MNSLSSWPGTLDAATAQEEGDNTSLNNLSSGVKKPRG